MEKEDEMSKLTEKDKEKLPESAFAFPKERKEPLVDATHVREAIARFDQVQDVTNKERDEAWKRIKKAAEKFNIELQEKDWRDLFKRNGRSIPKE
jgi:cell division protein FtsX